MKIEIRRLHTNEVIFVGDYANMREAVEAALVSEISLKNANLQDANLQYANLKNANLQYANLQNANLKNANLKNANLKYAYLQYANLKNANLQQANLQQANLQQANLQYANLHNADLQYASFKYANLQYASLKNAEWTPIRDDIWAVLSAQPREVEGLREAIAGGRIDGCVYVGECACLVGTLANVAGTTYENIAVKPNPDRLAERLFLAIKKGDTPENNQISALVLQWIDEWLKNVKGAFANK